MEKITLNKELRIMEVTARSFPDGIQEAFIELKKKAGAVICDRPFFGLSKPDEKGVIIYRACVLEMEADEAIHLGFELFVLPKGEYLTKTLADWKKNVQQIGETFREMVHHPDLDPSSFCIEKYMGESDVMCMVKIKDRK